MMPLLTVCGRLLFVLPMGLFVMGCTQSALQAPSPQENLGMGIVTGTLGAQIPVAATTGDQPGGSLVGHEDRTTGPCGRSHPILVRSAGPSRAHQKP